jgi:hypothetical protein
LQPTSKIRASDAERKAVGALQVSEKEREMGSKPEKHTSGAEAHVDFAGFMYGLKPVPFNASRFPAACKALVDFAASTARLKSCPDTEPSRIFAGTSFFSA